jgi:hypothetical protein
VGRRSEAHHRILRAAIANPKNQSLKSRITPVFKGDLLDFTLVDASNQCAAIAAMIFQTEYEKGKPIVR